MIVDTNQLSGETNMQYNMKIIIFLGETGIAIQSLLFRLGTSLNGLICDKEHSDHPGLL